MLKLEWDFPVFMTEADTVALEGSRAKSRREALPRDEAVKYVLGDDPRPVVVMRECGWCEGSDDALLSTRLDNERTLLMSHWFHMVKLPNHVLEEDHPFRNVFNGKDPAHLVVMSRDGSIVRPLSGEQSQTELWNSLEEVLSEAYEGDPDKALKRMVRVLDELDELDDKGARLAAKYEEIVEDKGPRSSKAKKLKKDPDKHEAKLAAARRQMEELQDLPLKTGE